MHTEKEIQVSGLYQALSVALINFQKSGMGYKLYYSDVCIISVAVWKAVQIDK